jgi:hypothetical protein
MSLHPLLAASAAVQGGPFTTAQALESGYEEREIGRLVKSAEWSRLRRGVLIATAEIPDDEAGRTIIRLRGLALVAAHTVVASHQTAATMHGLALLRPPGELLEVTRADRGSGRVEAGVHWHSAALPADHLMQINGVCCTTCARTVIDIARHGDFASGLVVAEAALNKGLTSLEDLRAVHELCLDWPGARNAGRVTSFASTLSESAGESLARIAFDAHGLPSPEQQVLIRDRAGIIARVDFLWRDKRTIGEFDGRVKYDQFAADGMQTLYDEKRREDRLRAAGFEVVRFGWSDILGRSAWVADCVRAAFARSARVAG